MYFFIFFVIPFWMFIRRVYSLHLYCTDFILFINVTSVTFGVVVRWIFIRLLAILFDWSLISIDFCSFFGDFYRFLLILEYFQWFLTIFYWLFSICLDFHFCSIAFIVENTVYSLIHCLFSYINRFKCLIKAQRSNTSIKFRCSNHKSIKFPQNMLLKQFHSKNFTVSMPLTLYTTTKTHIPNYVVVVSFVLCFCFCSVCKNSKITSV